MYALIWKSCTHFHFECIYAHNFSVESKHLSLPFAVVLTVNITIVDLSHHQGLHPSSPVTSRTNGIEGTTENLPQHRYPIVLHLQ